MARKRKDEKVVAVKVADSDGVISKKSVRRTLSATIPPEIKGAMNKGMLRKLNGLLFDGLVKQLEDKASKSKDPDKPLPIDFRQLSKYANPALDTVSKEIGQYNPDTIDANVYELMRKDPQLAAGLAMIKLPLMALPWRIESDDDDIAKFIEYNLKKIWKPLIQSMLTALDFGFAAHEKVWERLNIKVTSLRRSKEGKESKDDDKRSYTITHFKGDAALLNKVKPLYPSSVSVIFDDDQFMGIQQTTNTGDKIELPASKCFMFTNEKEFGNPFGKSRLKNAYKLWYWKELLYQFMLQYYERRGSPPVIVTAPPGKSEDSTGAQKDNLRIALDLGASFINNSVGALPYEESSSGRENMWKVEYLLDDRRGEMFIEVLNHLDAKCFLALFVPESLGRRGRNARGSFAEANVIADLFMMSEKALITDIESHVDRFIIPQLVDFNFPPEKRAPAYLKLDQLDFSRRLAVKEIFIEMLRNVDTMMQVGKKPNVLPDLEKMAQILEIPIVPYDAAIEETEMPEVPTGPGAAGGGANILPLKPRRRSDASRTETRKTIKPGTKPSEQQRARNTKFQVTAIALADSGMGNDYYELFNYGDGPMEEVRKWLTVKIHTDIGLIEFRKALYKIFLQSGRELIPHYEALEPMQIAQNIETMQDHIVATIAEMVYDSMKYQGLLR